jgi:hypothetical protein
VAEAHMFDDSPPSHGAGFFWLLVLKGETSLAYAKQ